MILWLLSNTLQHVDFMNSKKLFLESLIERLAIPLSNLKTVAKWLVMSKPIHLSTGSQETAFYGHIAQ